MVDDKWPAGPPHDYDAGPGDVCSACGVAERMAIHDRSFWARRGVGLVAAETYRRWAARHGSEGGGPDGD